MLTQATMERVEKLQSAITNCANHSTEKASMSSKKYNISRHAPISILKHKMIDDEGSEHQLSSGSSPHMPLPVTFSPSVNKSVSYKKHGILKKRSSLDESEILRRRSCSPDVFFADNIYSEFRPILKNQRRSSLDEIVKRDQSPDQQLASILKRKSFREDDKEIHQLSLGSPEPQSILKRKLANSMRANSVNHHVSIVSNVVANINADGSAIANVIASQVPDGSDESEVRPILKKKYSKEEGFARSDVLSLEPRPILKKKLSTELDEHEHDRPKKTILKSSRKNSCIEGGYETNATSPKKFSALKNRAIEIENVRPILKQPSSGHYHNDTCNLANSFLRKRTQSVGHTRSISDDYVKSIRFVLTKRRSLESSSPIDVSYIPITSYNFTTDQPEVCDISYAENSSTIEDDKLSCETFCQIKQNHMNSMEEKNKMNSHMYFIKLDTNIDNQINILTQTTHKKVAKEEDQRNAQKNFASIRRNDSISKMTQVFKENDFQSIILQKSLSSHGVQRERNYREHKKTQGGERFNTQPVTSQEMREAVLQNQRNITANVSRITDEPEPSKLLIERLQLFDEKIVTTHQGRLIKKKRLCARYKTQPITSEEIKIASQIFPLNVNQIQTFIKEHLKEHEKSFYTSLANTSHDLPKSILKSSIDHTKNLCAKSPEVQTVKLIKPVLKREFEESKQSINLLNSDVYLRSILKSNLNLKSIQTMNDVTSRSKRDLSAIENQNRNNETSKFCKRLDITTNMMQHSLQYFCDDTQTIVSKKNDNETMSSHKTSIFWTEKILSNYKIDTIPSSREFKKYNDKWHNNSIDKSNRVLNINNVKNYNNENTEDVKQRGKAKENDNDDGYVWSFSNNHEVFNFIEDEMDSNITRYSNSLIKNINRHLNDDKKPQLCRSATQVIASIETNETPSMSIADRLAALRHSGNTYWRQRVANDKTNESFNNLLSNTKNTMIKSSVLADCIEKLESSMESWKSRIAISDAINFTVTGKMKMIQSKDGDSSFITKTTTNISNQKKKMLPPQRFKTKKDEEYKAEHILLPTVSVLKMDDETFTSFFSNVSLEKCKTEYLDLDENDFNIIAPQSKLLVQKRNVRTQHRRATCKNPLKVLAARTDLRSEYTEIRTNIIAKIMKNFNIEKLAKNSSFSIEALAGLASIEDFSTVTLKNVSETSVSANKLQPYKDIMLILVKGRRHVQVRLIKPVAESINSGDNYLLVTKSEIFNYIGRYSNVIEKTRAIEIALSIQQQKDLGCQAIKIISINEDGSSCTKDEIQQFWRYLGVLDSEKFNVTEAGHPDEDELYESAIIDTNMVYELKNEQLVPHEKFWGILPKIEIFNKNKILVFDFGTEMYVWSGKGVSADKKKFATRLALEIWNDGYNYSECAICPINASCIIGNRKSASPLVKSAKSRPEWCLFAKLTQHVETILFREKFLDWPNITNVIKTRNRNDNAQQIDINIHLDDNNDMWLPNIIPVDLILEGCHLGRGTGYYDNELKKEYVIITTSMMVWHIDEFSHALLTGSSIGHFYSGDSYIVQWVYSVTITGRELTGLPSKYLAKGRDRSVYFIWQGKNASLNEQGAAALLTIKLGNGSQIRIVQGHEPAAFLNLFSGKMVVHTGKKSEKKHEKQWRLYICRGTLDSETFLMEISCNARQLRSRGSFVLLDTKNAKIYVWHGNNSLCHIKENAMKAANQFKKNQPEEVGLSNKDNIQIYEIQEGLEPEEFCNALGGMNKKLYWSLKTSEIQDHTPRLYHMSTISKTFRATEILCPHRADLTTPFPFLQDDLYQANQPALFLLDDKNVIWIWQGWWPDNGTENQSGSKTVRWQAERKAAMMMAIQYWQKTRNTQATNLPIYLVWAGLEPLQFINLFPEWIYRDDIAELNIEDGRNPGKVLTAENELTRLTQNIYPPAELLQRPLPDGVDPTHLESYLSQQHFQDLLGMSKEEFQQLPNWKQVNLKKEIGLF